MKKVLLVLVLCSFYCFSYSQNFVNFTDGNVIKSGKFEQKENTIRLKIGSSEVNYPLSDIAFILCENGTILYFNYDKEKSNVTPPSIDELNPVSSIKPGMSIFVKHASTNMKQRMGAMHILEYLSNDGTFNIVYTPIEAHFILEYILTEEGRDRAGFCIKEKSTNKIVYESAKIKTENSFNPIWEAKETVAELMKKEYTKFKKLILAN